MSASLGSPAVQAGLDATARRSAGSTQDVSRQLAIAFGPATLLIA
jgi:hypothetical protein